VNRRQRRAIGRSIESTRAEQERLLQGQARALRARILTSDEPLADRLRLVTAFVRELETSPAASLVAGPALVELRGLRDDLKAQEGSQSISTVASPPEPVATDQTRPPRAH
jgi:hypothetical protein